MISRVEIGGDLLTYAVSAPNMADDELSWFVDRHVTRALYGVEGVASVRRLGGIERQVRVDLDPQALVAHGVTQVVECGPGKVLSGLVKRIDKSVETRPMGTPAEFAAALDAWVH